MDAHGDRDLSLDIWINGRKCSKCKRCEEGLKLNYTYNCAPMWYAVRPQDDKMVMIDGLTGKQSIPILEQVISALEKSPEKFKAMNPENGWGSYDGFLQFLKELLGGAIKSPACRWKTRR